VAALCLFAISLDAQAARRHRHHFEPTDLELDDPGTLELDLQMGASHGNGPAGNRLFLPDFEADLGLFQNVELDIDGAFTLNQFDQKTRSWGGDSLWVASKLSLFDLRGPDRPVALAGGLQLGPRFPTIGARGIGYGALALLGIVHERIHVVGNFGVFIDPGPEIAHGQAKSVLAGVDLDLDLDAHARYSLLAELGVAHYWSADPDEVSATTGAAVEVSPRLELSIVTLVGFLPGQDRVAILVGASPRFPLWQ
jgi:hypothetical protein